MHDLAADLPAPRDDEPANLRRDILDELSDHLQCAIDRERQRAVLNGDETAAQNQDHLWPRVVARFGHPARIARQLWWDAMKEKIMSQRTQTATLVVMSLFCVAMMIVTLMTLSDSRQLARDNQALNKQLLAQLEDLANRPAAAPAPAEPVSNVPSEWNQLQVRCVWGDADGEPVEGARIMVTSQSENTAGIPDSEETTNAEGIADFGKVLYGTYLVSVRTPSHLESHQPVAVRPGQDKTVTVVCPKGAALGTVSLQPQFDWNSVPESLRDRVWVYCTIHADSQGTGYGFEAWDVDRMADYDWPAALRENGRAFDNGFETTFEVGAFLVNAEGQILPAGKLIQDYEVLNSPALQLSRLRRVASMSLELPEKPEYLQSIELPPGGYQIVSMIVVADPADEAGHRLLAIDSLPRGDGGMFGGSGGPMGFENWRAQIESQGRSSSMGGRGWGSREREREGTLPMTTQLGALPASFISSALPYWSLGMGSSSGYGGGSSSQSTYLVRANGEQNWEFPVDATETLFLADLALRVPAGTDITLIGAHILSEDEDAVVPGSVIDLVWKGLMVQPDNSVVIEEHLLLTGLDVIATGGEVELEGAVLKEVYVPISNEQAVSLLDRSMQFGIVARPTSGPPQSAGSTPLDAALVERIRNDYVAASGVTVDPSTVLKVIEVDANNSGDGDGMMDRGSTCDVVAVTTRLDGFPRSVPLLHNRIIQKAVYPGPGVETYKVGIIVTAEEEAVVSQFLYTSGVYTQALPMASSSVIGPLESSPHLESALLQLEQWQRDFDELEEGFEQSLNEAPEETGTAPDPDQPATPVE